MFVGVGRSLWRDDWSVFYSCCWPSPAQSFWGPSPVELATIFCTLRFGTFFPSGPTTRRATVEVFNPVSTRDITLTHWFPGLVVQTWHRSHTKHFIIGVFSAAVVWVMYDIFLGIRSSGWDTNVRTRWTGPAEYLLLPVEDTQILHAVIFMNLRYFNRNVRDLNYVEELRCRNFQRILAR
jgi:hypothetical protein